jgi:hypothetical protein
MARQIFRGSTLARIARLERRAGPAAHRRRPKEVTPHDWAGVRQPGDRRPPQFDSDRCPCDGHNDKPQTEVTRSAAHKRGDR